MKKWSKVEEEKRFSPDERSRVKDVLYRILLDNEVAIAYIDKGEIKVAQIWDYVCRAASVK